MTRTGPRTYDGPLPDPPAQSTSTGSFGTHGSWFGLHPPDAGFGAAVGDFVVRGIAAAGATRGGVVRGVAALGVGGAAASMRGLVTADAVGMVDAAAAVVEASADVVELGASTTAAGWGVPHAAS